MKTVLVLFGLALAMNAQAPQKPKEKTVTVTGSITTGVECLVLKNSKGKPDYSIAKSDKLEVGKSYTITGTVSEIGVCQEGKPILAPTKIVAAKLKPEAPKK